MGAVGYMTEGKEEWIDRVVLLLEVEAPKMIEFVRERSVLYYDLKWSPGRAAIMLRIRYGV